jgi:hypothetical protein
MRLIQYGECTGGSLASAATASFTRTRSREARETSVAQ